MLRTIHRGLLIGFAIGLMFNDSPECRADHIFTFNTDTGTLSQIDVGIITQFNGTTFQTSVVDGAQQFRFLGDLEILNGQQVNAIGSRPLSLFAGNDLLIAPTAILNFDAFGEFGALGGGDGGNVSIGGGLSGSGGDGVNGGAGASGGAGGDGIAVFLSCDCKDGEPGKVGQFGFGAFNGTNGTDGGNGFSGTGGFNNAGGVNSAGTGGFGGSKGFFSGGSLRGAAGSFGAAGGFFTEGNNGGPGGNGVDTANGTPGQDGGTGGDGLGGLNSVTGLLLSGGAGGSGGGKGGGGGGGGGAGGAGAGGSGGGGGGGCDFFTCQGGGFGGSGGMGGRGGDGANGRPGSLGGRGGAGAGAVEFRAQGKTDFAGTITARGANGITGGAAITSLVGGTGIAGSNGGGAQSGDQGGSGGIGGNGGDGGDGGNGGRGGAGGNGGGGAGGTVLFRSSLFDVTGATINTSPGNGGGNGRYLVARNDFLTSTGSAVGGTLEHFQDQGGGGINPFIKGGTTETFNLVDLVGGADLYGVKENLTSADPYFSSVVSGAPAGAIAAIYNQNIGSSGDNYFNQNSLFFINLTGSTLTNPEWGITTDNDASFSEPLLTRGFAENPLFGGDGADTLTALAPGGIYATIMPDATGGFQLNASVDGASVTNQIIPGSGDGTIFYLVGLPGDFDFDFDVDGSDFLTWQRGFGTTHDAGDLADWQANFGALNQLSASSAVPEASTLLLAAIGLPVLLVTGRNQNRRHRPSQPLG